MPEEFKCNDIDVSRLARRYREGLTQQSPGLSLRQTLGEKVPLPANRNAVVSAAATRSGLITIALYSPGLPKRQPELRSETASR